jgi:hypothetical protein
MPRSAPLLISIPAAPAGLQQCSSDGDSPLLQVETRVQKAWVALTALKAKSNDSQAHAVLELIVQASGTQVPVACC